MRIMQVGDAFRGRISAVCWMVMIVTILQIPVSIRQIGFQPIDDANRHVAKAISGKPWNEILVMRPDITIDTNPGWHAILRHLHVAFGWDADALMTFSIVGLWLLVLFSGLWLVARPEAWLLAFLIVNVANPEVAHRTLIGRPLIVSQAVLILLLGIWGPSTRRRHGPILLALTALLIALATWVHGSWYLFLLPVAAFALAGRIRQAMLLAACWAGGSMLGAVFTGHPLGFLAQHMRWASAAFTRHAVSDMLVPEFQPSGGVFPVVLAGALLAFISARRGAAPEALFRNPVFVMAVLGWALGMRVNRTWLDWGRPACILWMAQGLSGILADRQAKDSLARIWLCLAASVTLFLCVTSDVLSRWTENLSMEYISPEKPGLQSWLPEDGGILYSTDMRDFFGTFFENPTADWRYVLGFEPAMMREDDLQTFRSLQWNGVCPAACEPWIRKMRHEDRLLLPGSPTSPPAVPQLDWYYAVRGRWIGKLREP